MGYQDSVNGTAVTEAFLDENSKQVVVKYASAAARTADAALTAVLREGIVSTLDDLDTIERYDGSAWRIIGTRKSDSSIAGAFAPAGNNDATTTGSYTNWVQLGASNSVAVPVWAAKALVSVTCNYAIPVTAASNVYVNRLLIGSDASGTGQPVQDAGTGVRFGFTFHDSITLTATGAKTMVIQNLRSAGTGQWRADVSTVFSWRIDFIPA